MTTRTIQREDDESLVDQVVRRASENSDGEPVQKGLFVSSGSCLLNLALSDQQDGGYLTGKVVNEVGDRSSGKTVKCLSVLAEAAHNPKFDEYDLIFDDAEAANEFNLGRLFGSKTVDRVLPPNLDVGDPIHSRTVQDFDSFVHAAIKRKKPFIYILDSLDSISDDDEVSHADDVRKAREKGKEVSGSYGMAKAKYMSMLLRLIVSELKKTRSLLIIISQTRDNVDPSSFSPQTRAGGRALEFYCSYESWLGVSGKITTTVNEKPRPVGITTRVKITKNKYNGHIREVRLPIYYDIGIDDIGSCVDFLVDEGRWTKSGSGVIDARDLKLTGGRAKLIKIIETNDLIEPLHKVTEKTWLDIEEKLKLDRKPRYS